MACLHGEEFSRAGTDSPQDVQTNVIAVMNHFWPGPLHCPTPTRFRLSFNSGLVPVPELCLGVFCQLAESLAELLSGLFVLPIRPGLRHFQDVALLVQETPHGLVRAFHLILLSNM